MSKASNNVSDTACTHLRGRGGPTARHQSKVRDQRLTRSNFFHSSPNLSSAKMGKDGKKKPFIDKKRAVTYALMARPGDEEEEGGNAEEQGAQVWSRTDKVSELVS